MLQQVELATGEDCNFCPQCQQALGWQKGQHLGQGNYVCHDCQQAYLKLNFCPDCQAEVEKLQACGAASYFCHPCNSLKSKSRVKHAFKAFNADN